MFSIQQFAPTKTEVVTFVEPGTGVCWFNAASMAETLEFTTPSRYLPTVLNDHEYKEVKAPGAVGRPSLYVREEGVYILIMRSKSAYAAEFQRWLAYEVLPTIRKTGSFGAVPNIESEGSEFWRLIDGAIARGMEPERGIDLHHRFNGQAKPSPTSPIAKDPLGQIEERLRDIKTKDGWITPRDAKRKTRLVTSSDHGLKILQALASQNKGTYNLATNRFKFH